MFQLSALLGDSAFVSLGSADSRAVHRFRPS
jgi:hypothetical protein